MTQEEAVKLATFDDIKERHDELLEIVEDALRFGFNRTEAIAVLRSHGHEYQS